jgi:hypothetical protein
MCVDAPLVCAMVIVMLLEGEEGLVTGGGDDGALCACVECLTCDDVTVLDDD